MHDLGHFLRRGVATGHFDQRRIMQDAVGERFDLGRVGRREHEVLTTRGEDLEDLADVVNEAHVEHAIRFVEDKNLDIGKVDRSLTDVIEETTGRGHEDVDAATESVDLGIDPYPAEDHGRAEVQAFAVAGHTRADLGGEFACRREDEAARTLRTRAAFRETLEHRQSEGGGFARTGLRAAHEITTLKDRGDGLRLDQGGFGVTFGGNRLGKFGNEAKFRE